MGATRSRYLNAAWAIVLLSSMVPADLLHALEGSLAWEEPARLAGALAVGSLSPNNSVYVYVEDPEESDSWTLVRADRAIVRIHEWTTGPASQLAAASCEVPTSCPSNEQAVEDASVEVTAIGRAAQLRFEDAYADQPDRPRFNVQGIGVECGIRDRGPQGVVRFPQDDARVSDETLDVTGLGAAQLVADCTSSNLTASRPERLFLYDWDLVLHAAGRPDQPVRTGTHRRPNPTTGLMETATTVLEVAYDRAPIDVEVAQRIHLVLFSPAFLGVGSLDSPPGTGSIAWDDWQKEGDVGSFRADGEFAFRWQGDRSVGVTGFTLEGPSSGDGPAEPLGAALLWPGVLIVAAGAVAWLLVRILWPLFSKIAPARILHHPRRAAIHDFVIQEPGVSVSVVANGLGIPWFKTLYHVRRLEQAGRLRLHKISGRTAIFPANAGFRGREARVALLQRDTLRRVMDALRRTPGLDQARLAEQLGLSRPRMSQALKSLVGLGLVRANRHGRRLRYSPTPIPAPDGVEAESPANC